VGIAITAALAISQFDFVAYFAQKKFNVSIAVFLFGLLKGTYGFGGFFPGQTLVLITLSGLTCTIPTLAGPIFFVWCGVMVGVLASYAVGSVSGRIRNVEPQSSPFTVKELILAVSPTMVSTYFFNLGYWRSLIFRRVILFGLTGGAILCLFAAAMCSVKAYLDNNVDRLALLYSLGLSAYGLLTVGYALWTLKRESGQQPAKALED
jgi:hypothetical protein